LKLETLRIYDNALRDLWRKRVANKIENYDDSRVRHSLADRPYGFKLKTDSDGPGLLDADGNFDSRRMMQQVEKPRISVTRGGMNIAWNRNNQNPVRLGRFWNARKDYRVYSRAIRPQDISYTVDIFARVREDAQRCFEWLLFESGPNLVAPVYFHYPWEWVNITMRFGTVTDDTNYEPGEEKRFFQFSIPVVIEAYMFEAWENPGDLPLYADGWNPDAITSLRRVVKRVEFDVRECGRPNDDPMLIVTLPVVPPDPPPPEEIC